jgi:hypothetical protein
MVPIAEFSLDVCRLDDRPPLLNFGLLKSGERFWRLLLASPLPRFIRFDHSGNGMRSCPTSSPCRTPGIRARRVPLLRAVSTKEEISGCARMRGPCRSRHARTPRLGRLRFKEYWISGLDGDRRSEAGLCASSGLRLGAQCQNGTRSRAVSVLPCHLKTAT